MGISNDALFISNTIMNESLKILLQEVEWLTNATETKETEIADVNDFVEDVNVWGSWTLDFWEDIDTSETSKVRLKRYYNEIAREQWYRDIEEFYVKKKFDLALKWDKYSKSDDYLSNLLKTIAMDMWYTSHSKEFVMQNTLPNMSGKELIGR